MTEISKRPLSWLSWAYFITRIYLLRMSVSFRMCDRGKEKAKKRWGEV